MSYRIAGLPLAPFAALFGLSDPELATRGVVRRVAENGPATRFPCRVSLRDAASGEPVLLLNFEHLPVASPYRSRYAIYVRENAREAQLEVDEIPQVMHNRLLALRAFDPDGMLVAADLAEGDGVAPTIDRMLANPAVDFLHVHNPKHGCFLARADRA